MIFYSTGFRAINEPFINEDMYDPITGFCVIRDKDSSDYYHSRLVWLPEPCRKQLGYATEYTDKLAGQDLTLTNSSHHALYFLSQTGEAEIASRSRIEQELRGHNFFMPSNGQRHFLKSTLQERGCPVEIIEMMLGHWHTGEEGWTKNSALHPWDLRCATEKFLLPLLEELGLTGLPAIRTIPDKIKQQIQRSPHHQKKRIRIKKIREPLRNITKLLEQKPPAAVWLEPLGKIQKNSSIRKAFKPHEQAVLSAANRLLPEIYRGDSPLEIDNNKLLKLAKHIESGANAPQDYYKRLNYLIKVLEAGKESLGWSVNIPPRSIFLPKEYNLVRPALIKGLKLYRQIEQQFVRDLERPIPQSPQGRLTQIILSSILFGGIHHRKWLEVLLRGLKSYLFQFDEMLWCDLFVDTEVTPENKFQKQRKPSEYRRWIADPVTQMLIYRWLKHYPEDRKMADRYSIEELLQHYSINRDTTETFVSVPQSLSC
jgi:hypothetical protein